MGGFPSELARATLCARPARGAFARIAPPAVDPAPAQASFSQIAEALRQCRPGATGRVLAGPQMAHPGAVLRPSGSGDHAGGGAATAWRRRSAGPNFLAAASADRQGS